jgi:hypothetical protein
MPNNSRKGQVQLGKPVITNPACKTAAPKIMALVWRWASIGARIGLKMLFFEGDSGEEIVLCDIYGPPRPTSIKIPTD